jgi:hypothetical protein
MDLKPQSVDLSGHEFEVTPPKLMQVPVVRPQSFKRGGGRRRRAIQPPVASEVVPDPQVPLIFVTSFSPAGYKEYGERFLRSFCRFWPQDVLLAVFHEGQCPPIADDRILYFDLREDAELADFVLRHGANPRARGVVHTLDGREVRDFRFDALRFAPKVFALTSPVLPSSTWRVWIDADVETTRQIPETFFSKLLRDEQAVAVYLGRPPEVFRTSECGFVAYRQGSPAGRQFLLDLRENYTTGKVFGMPEQHDSFVFDALRAAYEQVGCRFHDLAHPWYESLRGTALSFEEHGHPWPHTRLGEYLTHHKGPRGKEAAIAHAPAPPQHVDLKRLLADPSIRSRYEQLTRILAWLPHESIVEVGVARGDTGIAMCEVNLARGKSVRYVGFDLFEDLTPEVGESEFNGKRVSSFEEVRARFAALADRYPGLFAFELVRGNTRQTLPAYRFPDEGVSFAFLDGGHSIETIRSDFEVLAKHVGLIVLDDYYLAGVDTGRFGCNSLVAKLPQKVVLPVVDRFPDGKEIACVATGPALGQPGRTQEVKVKTRNCVEDAVIQANIRNAARYTEHGLAVHVERAKAECADPTALLARLKDLDPGWRVRFLPGVLRPVETPVLFIGGAGVVTDPESKRYAENWARIRELSATHRVVVCKTSYAVAFREGVLPWACFLLDPRDHVAEWIAPPDCRVLFLVASMCDPSTWAHLATFRPPALGYHAGVGAQEGPIVLEHFGKDAALVHGGTTSSFRGISLLYNLGFRHFKTIGLDSSYEERPERPHGRSPKQVQTVSIGEQIGAARSFWTDPELIAQSQDAEMLAKLHPLLDIEYIGNGMLQYAQVVYRTMCERAPALDPRPVEHRFAAWSMAFKSNQPLSESLYIEEMRMALAERSQKLAEMMAKEPSFDEWAGLTTQPQDIPVPTLGR